METKHGPLVQFGPGCGTARRAAEDQTQCGADQAERVGGGQAAGGGRAARSRGGLTVRACGRGFVSVLRLL